MAMHNFNYTYQYVSHESVRRSGTDPKPLVSSVTVSITAVDQADNSKTITTEETRALDYFYLQDADLPGSFIPLANITDQNMIDWFKDGIVTADLDGYYTTKLYGTAEMDGT
tara:strand:+ start:1154 stop:1489 length:336 start_codon:yes stop_codon:yes gene_type:complete